MSLALLTEMGLQDRGYYHDSYSNPWDQSSYSAPNQRSVVVTLIIINCVIFLLDLLSPKVNEFSHWLSDFMALKPAEILSQPWQIWTLMSHGFAHASVNSKESFFHVGGNMLALFILGKPIETRLGSQEFIKFYLIAILVSGLGFLLLPLNPAASVVGASGAVSAVVALFVFFYPHSTLMLFGVFPIKTWILGIVFVGMDLLRSLNPNSPVAWQVHLAGFAFGFAYFRLQWNFSWIQLERLQGFLKRRPNLKLHDPAAKTEKLRQEGDRILEKINREGEDKLTAAERRTLKRYSKSLRDGRG